MGQTYDLSGMLSIISPQGFFAKFVVVFLIVHQSANKVPVSEKLFN